VSLFIFLCGCCFASNIGTLVLLFQFFIFI
jgi:hypothetical protein